MGTFVSISVYDKDVPQKEKEWAIKRAFAVIDSVDTLASRQRPNSELSRINRVAAERPVEISPLLFHIVRLGLRVARQTDGVFDPTVAPLLDLWGFTTDSMRVPPAAAIQKTLPRVDYRMVQIDSPRVVFDHPQMGIDFGGIAKGTAIDLALRELRKQGMQDVMIDAGGDLGIHSSEFTRGRIRVWIRHPRRDGELFGFFYQDSGAVATSGDYEQYFEKDGRRYCHILNPDTGYPDSDLMSVTVVMGSAEVADAYATGIFVMGWQAGIEFAKKHPELGVVLIARGDGKLKYWASENMKKRLKVVDDKL